MGKLVRFKFTEGSFEQGFSVEIEIGKDDKPSFTAIQGKLSPAPDIPLLYKSWQKTYRRLGFDFRIKDVEQGQITNIAVIDDCNEAAIKLYNELKLWLSPQSSPSFSMIREAFIGNIDPTDEVRVLLQTENEILQSLPWHRWDLIDNHPNAEIALSPPVFKGVSTSSKNKMRILAIFGSSEGINIETDRNLLSKFPNGKLFALISPSLSELNKALWNNEWDIIFFAGHSQSELNGSVGRIYINDDNSASITLDQLNNGLKETIKNGLKLAIFNSCDGMGLARSLFKLNIPQVIVMRERVPDKVAQEFLKYFLADFAAGTSLYRSVRRAREKLQPLEDKFPCATWLPIICQNPAETPLPPPPPKFLLILLSLLLLAGGLYGLWLGINCKLPFQTSGCAILVPPIPPIQDRMSFGEKIMLPLIGTPKKATGIAAFAARNYGQAVIDFETSLKLERNDPETLIYLNNARIGDQKSYTIAAIVPIGGANPNNAVEMLRGFAQAQDEINHSGGINGIPLRVAIINDDDRPKNAEQIAIALAQKPEILAVTGHWTSDVTLAAAPIYNSSKLVFITPISTTTRLSNFSPYVFRVGINNSTGGRALADYMLNTQQKKKVAIFFTSKAGNSIDLKSEFGAAVSLGKGQVVAEIDMSDSSFSPDQAVKQAIDRGAEAIMLATNNELLDEALKVIQANNRKLALIGDVANLYNIKTLRTSRESAVGLVIAISWHIQGDRLKSDPKGSKDLWSGNANWVTSYPKRSRDLWGGDVNWVTANSYNSLQALITALKRNPTRIGIQEALSSPDLNVPGTSGTFNFLRSGDVDLPVQLVKVVKASPSRSGTGYDFEPVSTR
jgi:branched-chain amino acid transport system substrate-binding protein